MTVPITVLLIDDHYLIHESVRYQLESHPGFQLVAIGTAGQEIEPLVEAHRPDVVLLDLGIPAEQGTTVRGTGRYQVLPAVRRLRLGYPETQFVILSAYVDPHLVEGALEAGAKGYLLKDDELSVHLTDAVYAVSKGGVYFSKEVARMIISQGQNRGSSSLTPRQVEVLLTIISNANLSYAEHARNLGISEDTFRNHLRAIFAELGASNITYAIIRAVQLGIIPAYHLGLNDVQAD